GTEALPKVEALARFGHGAGMAFQIIDDILDTVGEEQALGKPVGGDLREAKVTLPTIYALQRADAKDRRRLEEAIGIARSLADTDTAMVRDVIDRYDGFPSARQMAHQYISTAKDALMAVPPSASRDALAILADRIVDRDR